MKKSLILSSFVAAALLAVVAVTHSRSNWIDASPETAAMPTLLELHVAAEVHKIPAEEIEDQALVFPIKPR